MAVFIHYHFACANDKTAQKIHFFFSMRKRNKKKSKLKTVEKFILFPLKELSYPIKSKLLQIVCI